MKASRGYKAEEWVFKTEAELLKFKSKMLLKGLRILYGHKDKDGEDYYYDMYYHWRTQNEKFKKLHLDTWEAKEKKRLKEEAEKDVERS